MYRCHLLEFLYYHIYDKEGKKITVNCNIGVCNLRNYTSTTNWTWGYKKKGNKKIKSAPRRRNFCCYPYGRQNWTFGASKSHTFDKPILSFCHSVPTFKSRHECLGCGLTVQPWRNIRYVGYLSLIQTKSNIKNWKKQGY